MKRILLVALFMVFLSFIMGAFLLPHMPDEMASHWNSKGEVDNHMPKFWGLFLMPMISIGVFIMMLFLPMLDPLRKNLEDFRKYYDWIIFLIIVFMFYVHILTLLWNTGYRFSMTQMMCPAIGVLFFYIGVVLRFSKRNWFVGIRTPWTLSSDKVWEKTHKVGGDLFKKAGIIVTFGIFFPNYASLIILVTVLSATIYIVGYSYVEFKKEMKK